MGRQILPQQEGGPLPASRTPMTAEFSSTRASSNGRAERWSCRAEGGERLGVAVEVDALGVDDV